MIARAATAEKDFVTLYLLLLFLSNAFALINVESEEKI
ncbi:unnamed protein product [Linum tenue]|uniref:Uncharacterized protein n=1 Tax=Linum tenue TaxID=586396 RepID=A0AAV0KRQ4_9ROSI|nr:unnamed protein product [Linum tenue]